MKPQAWLIAINEFVGLDFNCDAASIQSGECIAATGEQMLDVFDIPHSGTGTPLVSFSSRKNRTDCSNATGKFLGILIALVVIWRIFAWIALRLRVTSL